MKYVKRNPPPPKAVHEFIFTEEEARYIRDLTSNLSNRRIAEIFGTTIEQLQDGGVTKLSYRIYDQLDKAFYKIDS